MRRLLASDRLLTAASVALLIVAWIVALARVVS